jgi:tetratricopeptide (TPR) repeat protein
MRRLPALLIALILPTAQPLLLGAVVSTGTLLVSQAPSNAQSAEAVAKVAQAITVRIEGPTQGSGVLVKREGNRYTVLTAWHVVSGQRPGEELEIFTPDGQKYQFEQGSIKRLGAVDMAVLSFSSGNTYTVGALGDVKSVSMGSPIFVAGFPLLTEAVNARILRFLKGDVIANANVAIANGYQLLYSNPTLPGMSGGAVLNAQGQLVGIHGQAETDVKTTEQQGVAVKTGTNQAVPINYFKQLAAGEEVIASLPTKATSPDDYLALAWAAQGQKSRAPEVLKLATQALALKETDEGYFYRGYAYLSLGKYKDAIRDFDSALVLNAGLVNAHLNRGVARYELGDYDGALDDYDKELSANPGSDIAWSNKGNAQVKLGRYSYAINSFNSAIRLKPSNPVNYQNRGYAYALLGNVPKALADYDEAIKLAPKRASLYVNRGVLRDFPLKDWNGAIDDAEKALRLDASNAQAYKLKGKALASLNRLQEADSALSRSVAIDSSDWEAWGIRGIIRAQQKDFNKAISDFNVAVKSDKGQKQFLMLRAFAYLYSSQKVSACKDFNLAHELGAPQAYQFYQRYCK